MANVNDLLNKHQDRIDKINRKRIRRDGAKRPWQENLEHYKTEEKSKKAKDGVTSTSDFQNKASDEQKFSERRTKKDADAAPQNADLEPSHSPEKVKAQNRATKKEHKKKTHSKGSKNTHIEKTHFLDTKKTYKKDDQTIEITDKNSAKPEDLLTQSTDTENGHNKGTKAQSTDTIKTQYRHTNRHNTDTENGHKLAISPSPVNPFFKLRGAKKRVVNFVYKTCIEKDVDSFLITYETLAHITQIRFSSIKTTAKRLAKEDQLITLKALGKGPGVQVEFGVRSELIKSYVSNQSGETSKNRHNTDTEYRHNTDTRTDTNALSSSSKENLEKTTTTSPNQTSVDLEQFKIPQSVSDTGFSKSHLKQVVTEGILSNTEIQESLDAFAYDLEVGNVNPRTTKLRLFLGILRKQKTPYVSEAMLEAEKADMEAYMERVQKAEEVKKQYQQQQLNEKFQKWLESLTEEQKREIAPPSNLVKEGSQAQRSLLRDYFTKTHERGGGEQ